MLILGIETSCDETAAAVIKATTPDKPVSLLSNVVASSLKLHAETGGIIPEIAAREQVKYILPVITRALEEASVTVEEVDAFAVTYGPGLIGSLLVGVETVKTLSYLYNKPIIPVNHMYGHIYANWIIQGVEQRAKSEEKKKPSALSSKPYAAITFPAMALVVSGGHTDLVLLKNHGDLTVIGGTRDDAAGEAFDKVGRLLGLPYPAGPRIAKLAEKGNPKAYTLPRPMIGSGDYDFSFSGLKTAVLNLTKNDKTITQAIHKPNSEESQQVLADLCASVQEAIVDIIVRKTVKAASAYDVTSLLLGGGVAANRMLTDRLREKAAALPNPLALFIPKPILCTDNAAMVAAAAFYNGPKVSWKEITANPELYY